MQSSSSGGDLFAAVFVIFFVALIILVAVAIWGTIFKKAGYSFWLGLLMLVPIANLIWILIFAFSKWPIQQQLEEYQRRAGVTGGFPVMPTAPPPQFPRT
jgi:uncharacterized protein (DUF983 family)